MKPGVGSASDIADNTVDVYIGYLRRRSTAQKVIFRPP
jgi:hypothetical protein